MNRTPPPKPPQKVNHTISPAPGEPFNLDGAWGKTGSQHGQIKRESYNWDEDTDIYNLAMEASPRGSSRQVDELQKSHRGGIETKNSPIPPLPNPNPSRGSNLQYRRSSGYQSTPQQLNPRNFPNPRGSYDDHYNDHTEVAQSPFDTRLSKLPGNPVRKTTAPAMTNSSSGRNSGVRSKPFPPNHKAKPSPAPPLARSVSTGRIKANNPRPSFSPMQQVPDKSINVRRVPPTGNNTGGTNSMSGGLGIGPNSGSVSVNGKGRGRDVSSGLVTSSSTPSLPSTPTRQSPYRPSDKRPPLTEKGEGKKWNSRGGRPSHRRTVSIISCVEFVTHTMNNFQLRENMFPNVNVDLIDVCSRVQEENSTLTVAKAFSIRDILINDHVSSSFIIVVGGDISSLVSSAFILDRIILGHCVKSVVVCYFDGSMEKADYSHLSPDSSPIRGATKAYKSDVSLHEACRGLKCAVHLSQKSDAPQLGVLISYNGWAYCSCYATIDNRGCITSTTGAVARMYGTKVNLFYTSIPIPKSVKPFSPNLPMDVLQKYRIIIWTLSSFSIFPDRLLSEVDGLVLCGEPLSPQELHDFARYTDKLPIALSMTCLSGELGDDYHESLKSSGFLLEPYLNLTPVQLNLLSFYHPKMEDGKNASQLHRNQSLGSKE